MRVPAGFCGDRDHPSADLALGGASNLIRFVAPASTATAAVAPKRAVRARPTSTRSGVPAYGWLRQGTRNESSGSPGTVLIETAVNL